MCRRKMMKMGVALLTVVLVCLPTAGLAQTANQPFLFALDDSVGGSCPISGNSFCGTLADGLEFNESVVGLHIPGVGTGTNFELWADDDVIPFRSIDAVTIDPNNGDIYISYNGSDRTVNPNWGSVAVEQGDIIRLSNYLVDPVSGRITSGTMTVVLREEDIFENDVNTPATGVTQNIDALHLLPNGNFLISAVVFTADPNAPLWNNGALGVVVDADDVFEVSIIDGTPVFPFVLDASPDSDADGLNDLPNPHLGGADAVDDVDNVGFVFSGNWDPASYPGGVSTNGIDISDGETMALDLITDPFKPYSFDFDMDGLLIGGGAVGQGNDGPIGDLDGLAHLDDTARQALINALIAGGGNVNSTIIAALLELGEPGACCNLATGLCTDVVDLSACLAIGPFVDFTPNETCATAVVCSIATGACCDRSTGICTDGVAITDCQGPLDEFSQDLTCAEAGCAQIPPNDDCANAILVTDGILDIDTREASTDGPTSTGTGDCGNGWTIVNDIWYRYVVPCSGTVAISTVGTGEGDPGLWSDTMLVVYVDLFGGSPCSGPGSEANCPDAGNPDVIEVFCNDDIIGGVNLNSYLGIDFPAGTCLTIRVGSNLGAFQSGQGKLRIECVPFGEGRCCFLDGSCMTTDLGTCQANSGFFTSTIDVDGDAGATDTPPVGCSTLPCPGLGEACFQAIDLNAALGGDSGTATRQIDEPLFYSYQITSPAVNISTCGSNFNTVLGIYTALDFDGSGNCTQNLLNINGVDQFNDDCIGGGSAHSPEAPCYDVSGFERDSCVCLNTNSVPGFEGSPLNVGDTILIAIGAPDAGDPMGIADPVPNPQASPLTAVINVTPQAACAFCGVECQGGDILENEPNCAFDNLNGGCQNPAPTAGDFQAIACGDTVCGTLDGDGGNPTGRDEDWYEVQIAAAQVLTWSVEADKPVTISVFRAGDAGDLTQQCLDAIGTSDTTTFDCGVGIVSFSACPGTYWFVVRLADGTSAFCAPPGDDPNNTKYSATLTCDPLPFGCCAGDLDNNGMRNGEDIQLFVEALFSPPEAGDPLTGCGTLAFCLADADAAADAVNMDDIDDFVSLLLGPAGCPAIPLCNDRAKCQFVAAAQAGGSTSDSAVGFRVADDFKLTEGGDLTDICYYGFYVGPNNMACDPDDGDTPDLFFVTYYDDAGFQPGALRAGPLPLTINTKTATGTQIIRASGEPVGEYRYEASHDPVAALAGETLWIQVTNDSSFGTCGWRWRQGQTVNDLFYQDSAAILQGAYSLFDGLHFTGDMAYCVNLRMDENSTGSPLGRCCINDDPNPPICLEGVSNQDCHGLGGRWEEGVDCTTACVPELLCNGGFVTGTGDGAFGFDTHARTPPCTTLAFQTGFGDARVADDFTVPGGETWELDACRWFAYQTFAPPIGTVNFATLRIWDGPPGAGGSVIFGDTTTDRFLTASFSNVFRVRESPAEELLSSLRAIQEIKIDLTTGGAPLILGPGTYWVDVHLEGLSVQGPWSPPTEPHLFSDNGRWSSDGSDLAWLTALDGTCAVPLDFIFCLDGDKQ